MADVLRNPGPLSSRAREFLRRRATRAPAERGPDDAGLRARLAAVFPGHGDEVVEALRRTQIRYLGLTYDSPLFDTRVLFEPTFDPDPGDPYVEFDYAVLPDPPTGQGASVLLDGTVMVGFDQWDAPAFPSLDHFIECDALLDLAARHLLVERYSSPDAEARVTRLLAARPSLRAVPEASGRAVQWWADDDVLVHLRRAWHHAWGDDSPTLCVWSLTPGVARRALPA